MHLSALSQSGPATNRSPAEAVRETLALGPLLESLGYHRFWLGAHHGNGSAPEILLAALAATTGRIRLGSAGIMLPHDSSLKIAEQFRALEALAPGRIDLGVGGAPWPGGHALSPNASAGAFPARMRDLLALMAGAPLPETHPFGRARGQPAGPNPPEIWVFGDTAYGAQAAAFFGLPYCHSSFVTEGQGAAEALKMYRETYRPSDSCPSPVSAIALFALAAESQAEADRLLTPRDVWRAERGRGHSIVLPSPEEATSYEFTEPERRRNAELRASAAFGTPDMVCHRLRAIQQAMQADELILVTAVEDAEARRRSFTLIAQEMQAYSAGQAGEHETSAFQGGVHAIAS